LEGIGEMWSEADRLKWHLGTKNTTFESGLHIVLWSLDGVSKLSWCRIVCACSKRRWSRLGCGARMLSGHMGLELGVVTPGDESGRGSCGGAGGGDWASCDTPNITVAATMPQNIPLA
jgi:hypothetical protein